MSKFIPRAVFPHFESIPRSYFLGHHRAGLEKMKSRISSVDLVIECRDFRVPVCSVNPLFDEALGEKRRLIVYTKRDLGGDGKKPNQEVSRYNPRMASAIIFLLDNYPEANEGVSLERENHPAMG